MLKILPAFILFLAACLLACHSATTNVTHTNASHTPTPRTHLYQVTVDGKYGFIDQSGNLKFTLPDDVYTRGHFSEGFAVVAKRVPNTNGRWGFIDETGKMVIEAKFSNAKPFSEGLAAVLVTAQEGTGARTIGYVDRSGSLVIQPQFPLSGGESNYSFSEGLAPVPFDQRTSGYIDRTGKFVIEPEFAIAFSFTEGRGMVAVAEPEYSVDYKWGFVDKSGQLVVPMRYDSATQFSEGLAAVLVGKKVGFIDLQGKTVIEPQFDPDGGCPHSLGRVGASKFVHGLAPVQVARKWGFIDRAGKWVIKPVYDCAEPFSEGLAVVGIREGMRRLFGYIDKSGTTVIKPQFAFAQKFMNNLAMVGVGMTDDEIVLKSLLDHHAGKPAAQIEKEAEDNKMKHGYIDKSGKFVWKPTK